MSDSLNPQQREVIDLRRHCIAVACPGAGKTRTLAEKAAALLAEPGVVVGAVTFSKDASDELRTRILALAGDRAKPRLITGTFHKLAYQQLGRPGGKRLEIARDGDRAGLVQRVLTELGLAWKADEATVLIEKIKVGLVVAQPDTDEAALYQAYQDALGRNGKIDFQDMLALAVSKMDTEEIEPYAFTHLLVDEFQDTDPLQYRWIEHHAKANAIVTVVGDDDQSIYGFRSALGFRGMDAITQSLDAQRVVLGSNYRCRSEILDAADRVIRHNIDRIPKILTAEKGPGGSVIARRFEDEYADAVALVETLAGRLANGESCATLARTNRMLDPFESVCRSHGVPYYRTSNDSILDGPEAALLCNLLEIVQRSKAGGLDAILAFAGIGSDNLKQLHQAMGPELGSRQKKELVALGLSDETATAYRMFMKRLVEWQDLCERQLYALTLEGVFEWLLTFAKHESAIRRIRATYDVIARLNGRFNERIEFLQRANNQPKPGAMILTTMHSAKGLEWDHVWITRAEEGVVPDDKSSESEERRLFYVAMTRARETLTISSLKKGGVSRFVIESGIPTGSDGRQQPSAIAAAP